MVSGYVTTKLFYMHHGVGDSDDVTAMVIMEMTYSVDYSVKSGKVRSFTAVK